MLVVPAAVAFTRPVVSPTLATEGALLVHNPPAVASVKV